MPDHPKRHGKAKRAWHTGIFRRTGYLLVYMKIARLKMTAITFLY